MPIWFFSMLRNVLIYRVKTVLNNTRIYYPSQVQNKYFVLRSMGHNWSSDISTPFFFILNGIDFLWVYNKTWDFLTLFLTVNWELCTLMSRQNRCISILLGGLVWFACMFLYGRWRYESVSSRQTDESAISSQLYALLYL